MLVYKGLRKVDNQVYLGFINPHPDASFLSRELSALKNPEVFPEPMLLGDEKEIKRYVFDSSGTIYIDLQECARNVGGISLTKSLGELSGLSAELAEMAAEKKSIHGVPKWWLMSLHISLGATCLYGMLRRKRNRSLHPSLDNPGTASK